MRLLILARDIGHNAPGIVFERLIFGLAGHHKIDVICGTLDSSIDWTDKGVKFIRIKYTRVNWRIRMFFISAFGFNPFDHLWAWKVRKKAKTLQAGNYDVVISLLYAAGAAVIIAGTDIARDFGCRHMAHLVDAVPAPVGWLKNGPYYKGLKKIMARHLSKVDALCSTNEQMLQYQLEVSGAGSRMVTGVLYNPYFGPRLEFPLPDAGPEVFVFTGGLYGPRTPRFVIEAFVRLLDEYPDARLVFVGKTLPEGALEGIEEKKKANIEDHPYTRDLTPYYTAATALLDIDAIIENDVFISSKVVNYINTNRIIISETGINSAARKLFGGLQTVLQCNHDAGEICEAMKKAITMKRTVAYEERKDICELFRLENVIGKMNGVLAKITGDCDTDEDQ